MTCVKNTSKGSFEIYLFIWILKRNVKYRSQGADSRQIMTRWTEIVSGLAIKVETILLMSTYVTKFKKVLEISK